MTADRRTPTPGSPTIEPGGNYATSVNEEIAELYNHGNYILLNAAGVNDITATCFPPLDAYAAGQTYGLVAPATNTTHVRVNVGSRGLKSVLDALGAELEPGAFIEGCYYKLDYDGTALKVVTDPNLRNKVDKTQIVTSQSSNSDLELWPTSAVRIFLNTALIGIATGLHPVGNMDCSANPNYPAAVKGDLYFVTVAGKIGGASGTSVLVGDFFYATADSAGGTQAAVGSSWAVVPLGSLGQAILASANVFTAINTITMAATGLFLKLRSTAAGSSTAGPDFDLFRDGASAAGNLGGMLRFKHQNSIGTETVFASIVSKIVDASNGSEDGELLLKSIIAGTDAVRFHVGSGFYSEGVTGGDKGAGTVNVAEIYENNSRVLTAASVLTPTDAAVARTMQDLWGMDRLTINTQSLSAATDITAAWDAAMALAAGRTRTAVMLGHGVFNNPNAATLLIPQAAGNLTVFGMGRDASSINCTYTGGDLLRIGTTGAAQIDTVTLAHFTINAPGSHAAGACVAVERGNHIWLEHMKLSAGFKAITFGAGASAIANDCQNIFLIDVWAQNNALSNVVGDPTPLIHAISGSGLIIEGGRWSGAGSSATNRHYCMIRDGSGSFNWDSILCRDVYGENIGSLVQCLGRGISGLSWLGGNIDCGDGTLNGFEAAPLTSAVAKDWLISHAKIGGIKGDMIHMSDDNGGLVYSHVISNNIFSDVDGNSIYIGNTGCEQINIHGNMHRGCGKGGIGTSIIRNGMRSGHIFGETARVDTGAAFTVLVEWRGAAVGLASRKGPIGTTTQAEDMAFCTAVGGSGAHGGLYSDVPGFEGGGTA